MSYLLDSPQEYPLQFPVTKQHSSRLANFVKASGLSYFNYHYQMMSVISTYWEKCLMVDREVVKDC